MDQTSTPESSGARPFASIGEKGAIVMKWQERLVHIPKGQLKNHTLRALSVDLGDAFDAYAFEEMVWPSAWLRERGHTRQCVQFEILYNGAIGYLGRSDHIAQLLRVKGHTLRMLEIIDD
jgi:hypothetical protein